MYGQSATAGALEGTVKDAAGVAVPDVTVRLLNHATDEAQTVVSDGNGTYRFSTVPPATYEAAFSAKGFKTSLMMELTVNASEVPAVEVMLVPGDSNESTPCFCRIVAATSTGTLIDRKTITSVPLNTRNFTQVLSMSSGSAADVNNAGTLGRGSSSVNVNGNSSAGAYTIDGAYAPSTVPNPDAISEFKIQTSQYDAMYGAMAPSTALITKRGENDWHGDVWEFVRNDVFNANAFFRNATGQPKPNLKQNQFGATLGSPLKKNKLFAFGSYQGTLQVNGLDPTSISNLILPALGSDRSATTLAAQFCPGNQSQSNSRYATFAGGKQLDCLNRTTATTAPINPVALKILQAKGADGAYLIPSPQTIITSGTNAGLGFSSYSLPSTYREHHYLGNIDYVATSKNMLSLRLFGATVDQLRTFGSPGGYPGAPVVPGWGAPQALTATDIATSARLTTTLSANVVNEATVAFTRNNTDTVGVGTPDAAAFGMTAADPLFARVPEITVLGPLGTFRAFGTSPNDNHFQTETYTAADNFFWMHGKQRIRMGGFYLNQFNGRSDTGGARGKILFQTFSDFLVGLSAADNLSPAGRSNIQTVQASEGVGVNGDVVYNYRRQYGSIYLQDDIKLTPHFTLNVGLRWEYVGPSLDTAGTIGNVLPSLLRTAAMPSISGTFVGNVVAANYDPSLINPYTGKSFGAPPDGVRIGSTNSLYQNATPLDTFAPRTGFAWQPFGSSSRITLGGGYGWFYQAPTFSGNASSAPLFTSAPFAQSFTNADASNNRSNLGQPFPTTTLGFVARTPTSQLSDRIAGPEYKIPRVQQWNFSTRLRVTEALALDMAYVGSHGDRLLLAHGLNQPLLASTANPVNCGYDGIASHCITTNTSQNAMLRVPIMGETPTALLSSEFAGSSTYQSMQATLRGKYGHKLSFQIAYTFSKALSDTTVYNDQNNLSLDRARASFDRTHRAIGNFDYQLPAVFRSGSIAGGFLNGWSAAGIIIAQGGLPMTLTDPNAGSVYGRAGASTITLCPSARYAQLTTPGDVSSRLGHWIDSSVICGAAALGSDGATGYGTAGQSILNGPGQVNTDVSLGKRARVGGLREDGELAFRVEFYNALNHSQFTNPGTTLGNANFGVITQSSVAPRLIQFALKYLF